LSFWRLALKCHVIEEVYKGVKVLGFGEYKFQRSEAALIYVYLVCLAFILFNVFRWWLLRYGVKKSLLTILGTVEWVRGQTGDLFIHLIKDSNLSNKSLMRMINTK
jgi:hypothetical protein